MKSYQVKGIENSIREIVSENDKGIPPVQTLLTLFKQHGFPVEEISDYDSQCMGELMAYVFKYVFCVKSRKIIARLQTILE